MESIVLLVLLLGLYFIPFFIAKLRSHPMTAAIFVLNLLAGWTLIGWVVAIVWAFANKPEVFVIPIPPETTRRCPNCAETIMAAAKVCRFCGRDLEVVDTVDA